MGPTERHPAASPHVVDEPVDRYGAEAAAARLARRIEELRARWGPATDETRALTPAFDLERDHVDGPPWASPTVVLFGAYASPSSRAVARVLAELRAPRRHRVRLAWRHLPDPAARPREAMFALAAEAAGADGRFWALTYKLLALRHHDPEDLDSAVVAAGIDPGATLQAMRAGTGTQRILEDVESAHASGVRSAPAVFIDGERYRGALDAASLSAALDAAAARGA